MNKEDYFKYYIQGSDHYLIPKDIFNELFNEMSNWKEDTKKYKEEIERLQNIIEELEKYKQTLNKIKKIMKEPRVSGSVLLTLDQIDKILENIGVF